MTQPKTVLCIPTLNAGKYLPELLAGLGTQVFRADSVCVIDSSSRDDTREAFERFGADVHVVAAAEFDHGGTRQLAVDLYPDAEIVMFLTQDAIPAGPDALDTLARAFADPNIGAAYGRQLPRRSAGPIEAHARLFNYPAQSVVKSAADASDLGIKVAFLSNSFSAYRRSALQQVGGFPSRNIFGEDMYAASCLLVDGWKIAYVAEAQVFHSHPYTHAQEFRRYFDAGVFLSHQHWITEQFGRATGEGWRYLCSELRYVAREAPSRLPSVVVRTLLKLCGMRVGQLERMLPVALKRVCTMNRAFWM